MFVFLFGTYSETIRFNPFLSEQSTLEGAIEGGQKDTHTLSPGYGVRHRGFAGNFLESKGFGWLMEEDDTENQQQKPLL